MIIYFYVNLSIVKNGFSQKHMILYFNAEWGTYGVLNVGHKRAFKIQFFCSVSKYFVMPCYHKNKSLKKKKNHEFDDFREMLHQFSFKFLINRKSNLFLNLSRDLWFFKLRITTIKQFGIIYLVTTQIIIYLYQNLFLCQLHLHFKPNHC